MLAFPTYTPQARRKIERAFFRNLCDYFIETLKLLCLREKAFLRRVEVEDEIVFEYLRKNHSVFFLLGHNFHWEWANFYIGDKIAAYGSVKNFVFYLPLTNPIMDNIFRTIRQRASTQLLSMWNFRAYLSASEQLHALSLLADHRPIDPQRAYWVDFFDHPTAFSTVAEKLARSVGMKVVFVRMEKPKRGRYRFICEPFTHVHLNKTGEFTKAFARALQRQIEQNPALYLWSHNRFKFSFNPEIHTRI